MAAMPDHACGQLVSLLDRPGASFGSGMAYRVWRTVRDAQGKLAMVRSHEVIRSQPSSDQPAATENRSAPMDDEQTAHRLTELVAAHERLYELTRDKRLIEEAMDGHHLDSVLSSGAAPEGWTSAAVEIRAIGHRLNREGGKPRAAQSGIAHEPLGERGLAAHHMPGLHREPYTGQRGSERLGRAPGDRAGKHARFDHRAHREVVDDRAETLALAPLARRRGSSGDAFPP